MKQYDYIIVGAGLYGAMFAFRARNEGKHCLIIDKNPYVGGFCYTEDVDGITIHKKGAHIFRTNKKEVWDFVNSVCEFYPFTNSPIALTERGVFNLPFNMNTFCKLWGCVTPEDAEKALKERIEDISNPSNLEEYVKSKIGNEMYELFIKGYTEKQWGQRCDELPISIISDIPIRMTYDNNYFKELYQGIPSIGYTKFIEKLVDGCDILLNTNYFEVKDEVDSMCKGKVVYTGPIDRYFEYKYGRLPYRSVRFEERIYDKTNVQGNAVVNYTSIEVPYTRSIEHRHFDRNCKSERSIVSYEYPTWDGEECYPIESERNLAIYRKYEEDARELDNVIFGGRLAEYRYYSMNDIIEKFI